MTVGRNTWLYNLFLTFMVGDPTTRSLGSFFWPVLWPKCYFYQVFLVHDSFNCHNVLS